MTASFSSADVVQRVEPVVCANFGDSKLDCRSSSSVHSPAVPHPAWRPGGWSSRRSRRSLPDGSDRQRPWAAVALSSTPQPKRSAVRRTCRIRPDRNT